MNREGLRMRRKIGLRNTKLFGADQSCKKTVGRNGTDRTLCSCHMCRNPRHSKLTKGIERLTMQERRHMEAWAGIR